MRPIKSIFSRLYIIAIVIITMAFANSCTDPDHTNSPLFGSWHLESIEINAEPDEAYNAKPEIMVSFQGNIFNMAYMERAEIIGAWTYAGEILTLDVSYKAGNGANIGYLFNPFPVIMGFPEGMEQLEITVSSLAGKTMQWQYINYEGKLYTYNFRKYP